MVMSNGQDGGLSRIEYVDDGDEIVLGDTSIKMLFIPGHKPGELIYIFPMHENSVEHMASMWGGANPALNIRGVVQQFHLFEHFLKETDKSHYDVVICNHPGIDSYAKIEYAKTRKSHLPNAYIIGENEFNDFYKMYRYLCYVRPNLTITSPSKNIYCFVRWGLYAPLQLFDLAQFNRWAFSCL